MFAAFSATKKTNIRPSACRDCAANSVLTGDSFMDNLRHLVTNMIEAVARFDKMRYILFEHHA